MRASNAPKLAFAVCVSLLAHQASFGFATALPPQTSTAQPAGKAIGAIKSISSTGSTIVIATDSGPDLSVTVQPNTQILRIAPGEKSLSNATPIQPGDLQVGDRIRVTGQLSDDKSSLVAAKIVAIKLLDLEAKHKQDLQDWQKRGVDGLATAVDAGAATVTLSVRNKSVLIHSLPGTVIRRYPPDSVKFDDARSATFQEIHVGDQVRARGNRSADGGELTAEEIVSGSFRNIAGTINSIDSSASTLSVHDLLSKKNLVIKITSDSQLRHLPPEMAQRIAARLKGSAAGGTSAAAPAGPAGQTQPAAGALGGIGAGQGARGAPDFQQMLSRIPASSLADLHKGDAVVIVSTEGTAGDGGTAITLLSGVEPILQSAPGASSTSILTPWSLSAPGGDSGGP
jgi:hypothetical protein